MIANVGRIAHRLLAEERARGKTDEEILENLERIEEIWSEGGLRLAGELAHAVRVEVAREIRGA